MEEKGLEIRREEREISLEREGRQESRKIGRERGLGM